MTNRRLSLARFGVLVLIVVNLLLAGGALVLRAQDDADPVSVDAAIERYRTADPTTDPSSTPSPTAARPEPAASSSDSPAPRVNAAAATPGSNTQTAGPSPSPEAGVYVYDTTGFEETDALGGARHDYPKQTTVTIRPSGCGITMRWDIFEQRSDTTELCTAPDGGTTIASIDARHEFYGQQDHTIATCEPGSVFQPARNVAPGATWTYRCASTNDTNTTTATLLGRETMQVGGASVDVMHIRQHSTAGGASSGSIDRDMWLAVDNGLLIRDRGQIRASTQRGGIHATYDETYEITLTSVRPHS